MRTIWQPLEALNAADPTRQLQQFRYRLTNRVFVAAGVLALSYLPVLLWRVHELGWLPRLQLQVLLDVVTLLAVLVHRWLPYAVKSGLLIGLSLLVGLHGIFTMGMVGGGYWWCLQAALLTAAFHSMRAGLIMTALLSVLLVLAAAGFIEGVLVPAYPLDELMRSASGWTAFVLVMVFAPLLMLLAFAGYQNTIGKLVAEVVAQRNELSQLVDHDQLTGLPQAHLAMDRLRVALQHALRSGRKVALLFADLDGFKGVNDRHGHAAGDHLLQQVAARLRESVREQDTVARVGGDEFMVLLPEVSDTAGAIVVAEKIIAAITREVPWQGRSLHVGVSIGIAIHPDHAEDAEQLRRLADAAMYKVKQGQRNGWSLAKSSSGVPSVFDQP